jgi:muramidase (phage lysozyme)
MAVIDAPANVRAFLDTLAWCEGTAGKGEDGYNILVNDGGADEFFHSYKDHPRVRVFLKGPNVYSDAAGRYQILSRWWDQYKTRLHLLDFMPENQDRYAINLIKECKAYNLIVGGAITDAFTACRSRWASLPGAGYNQRERTMAECLAMFVKAGGTISK